MNMTTVPSNQLKAMQHEIADLKEQVALYAGIDDEKACIAHLLDRANETIAQQAEAIRVKNEALFTAYTTFTEYAQIHSAKQPPDTRKSAFNFDRANQMNAAITIQPSPETLQARDERVAEACAKVCIEQSEGIARSAPVSRDRVHTLVENTMFKGIARPAQVRDCSESSVRESAFRIRNGAWERHL